MTKNSASWFIRPKPLDQAPVRMFCIPFAGGGTAAFRGWGEAGAPDLEVVLVQLPGRETRIWEPPLSSISSVIPFLVEKIWPWLDRPFVLYGHSLGGLLAFELSRELERKGKSPRHLFVGASPAPHLPRRHPKMHHLPDEELLAEVNRRYQAVPAAVLQDPEIRQLLLPCLRADLTMLETHEHTPGNPLSCAITGFGALGDGMVPRDLMDPWSVHTANAFRLEMLDGSHMFLQSARVVLIDSVRRTLRESAAAGAYAQRAQEGQGENGTTRC